MSAQRICSVAIAALFVFPAASRAANIAAGYDILTTLDAYQDFSSTPIPADFFAPGSDPFVGVVVLGGEPVILFPPCGTLPMGPTDTVIERKSDAILPNPGDADVVPIEILQLNLVSINPITVTYNGGTNPEQWHVRVTVSSIQPSLGSMTITLDHSGGGTFDSQLRVYPRFVFTRLSDHAVRVLDDGMIVNNYSATGSSWSHSAAPMGCMSCNATNFFPGVFYSTAFAPWHCTAPNASQTFQPACPTGPVATENATWGTVKALYR